MTEIEGIGRVRLRLIPTEEELIRAERAKRARGFFLSLIETLLIEPSYVREDWVRLPEGELRKLALMIAEANELSPYFKPKREKRFYNAFRNAWRMKRSSHNEAVFQRAIAAWKAHLEKGLSAAAFAYKEAVGEVGVIVKQLAQAGFVLAPTALAKVASKVSGLEQGAIGATLEATWSDEELAEIVDGWFDLEPFRRREGIIRAAFGAYLHGEYELSIYGLFPQPEGVMWDFLSCSNPAEAQLEELIGTQNRTFVTVEALIREVLSRLIGEEDLPFYRFVKFVDVVDDGSLNRHAVEHGVLIEFGTKQNALRMILYLDFAHFVLGKLRE
ncbi:hypothetical protein KAX17_06075 [Candidatus Bipolaricaulota bacterium]|nr:hypothetical protein [Candidatus Bipolaricaulota bacterium]